MGSFKLRRRDEPDCAVDASVIEPVDVLGDGDLDVADGRPAAAVADRVAVHSALSSELNASTIALSYGSPVDPTEATASASASRSV